MNVNYYTYYGALCPKSEVTSHMVQLGKQDMYSFIMEKGLQYRKYGHVSTSYQIVVGRELSLELDDETKFMVRDNKHIVLTPDVKDPIKLNPAEEQRIRESLLILGIYEEPRYYVFVNFEA